MDWLLDDEPLEQKYQATPWKVAIVDDDEEVHKVTKLTLKGFEFEDRQVEFLHAYSGIEARKLFKQHDDIALVLLDVVMEDEHAGLEVVKFIRNELHNHFSRIVLRTGQPGSAPEEQVIREYDIDDYKSKTEFTKRNLNLLFYTNLRAYRDIHNIQRYQKGLKAVIDAMVNLAETEKVSDFAAALMQQLAIVLNSSRTEFIMQDSEAFTLTNDGDNRWHIMVNDQGTEVLGQGTCTKQNESFVKIANQALEQKQSMFEPPLYAHYYLSKSGIESVFILRNSQLLSDFNQQLLQIFSQNAVLTLEHLFKSQSSH